MKPKYPPHVPGLAATVGLSFLALTIGAHAQLPEPYLYYNFEEGGGNTVTDLSGNDHTGEIRSTATADLSVDGAPDGPTPGGGIRFNAGAIDVRSIDVNANLRDLAESGGSYTMTAWAKPIESAGGEGFYFGQTNQGMHIGLRAGGRLHTAHWGADFSANTVLARDEWVHTAFVYDGPNDQAWIYLNGELDGGPFGQRAPNGDGHFLVGATNNGRPGNDFKGCLDEVGLWREMLSPDDIQALAEGA
ncbi:MAG: LamG domain-containing protein, partial [Akkermansiaceae bacterium]|nr:LamG domain-containing protein [Akkermansiaceae bacterium]